MAAELRADPDALIRLADTCLAVADRLGEHYRTGRRDLAPPPGAFGNTAASAAAARAAAALLPDAQDAMQAHVQVVEDDADRLLQAAFAYAEDDRLAAEGMGGSRRAPL